MQQEIINNEILVVSFQKYILFTKIDGEWLRAAKPVQSISLKRMNLEFKPQLQILRIQGIANRNHFQIVAREILKKVVIVLTWDTVTNSEVSMFQSRCEKDLSSNYGVRGMNEKSNYFISASLVFDLENNLPFMSCCPDNHAD